MGYKTMAERGAEPGSAVFVVSDAASPQWWRWVDGAHWRRPQGSDSRNAAKDQHLVVHIAYDDALAYAQWKRGRLPTEAEWEYAALGGKAAMDEPTDAKGKTAANCYQGLFPIQNDGTDGFIGTAPAGCFAVNGYGLYDMLGNVWEWTSEDGARTDAIEPVKVIKGGSYLCAANFCARYRPAARQF